MFAPAERQSATLAADNPGSEEVIVRPGESRRLQVELRKGVTSVGVAALFRDIDRAAWRVPRPVPASGPMKLVSSLKGTAATLTPT